jgi:hypothetical protein
LHRGKEEVARCKFAAVGELPESMELVAGVKGKSEHRKLKKGIGKTGTGDELNRMEEIFFLNFYILALSMDGFHI